MIEVDVSGPAVRGFPRREIARFVSDVFAALRNRVASSRAVGNVSIALVDDAAMSALNKRFRHKHRTTDVLTFPAVAGDGEPGSKRPLGDIVISLDQARRQSRSQQHSLPTELRYLLLHGIVHALGFDHEADDGEMNALEMAVRTRVGLR